jgi:hypothetical protein
MSAGDRDDSAAAYEPFRTASPEAGRDEAAIPVHVSAGFAAHLIAQLQLALSHPENTGTAATETRSFIRALQQHLAAEASRDSTPSAPAPSHTQVAAVRRSAARAAALLIDIARIIADGHPDTSAGIAAAACRRAAQELDAAVNAAFDPAKQNADTDADAPTGSKSGQVRRAGTPQRNRNRRRPR